MVPLAVASRPRLPAGDAKQGWHRKKDFRTNSGILTPPTSSTPGRNGWTFRRCSATRASVPPRLTPTLGRSGWSRGWGGCESQPLAIGGHRPDKMFCCANASSGGAASIKGISGVARLAMNDRLLKKAIKINQILLSIADGGR